MSAPGDGAADGARGVVATAAGEDRWLIERHGAMRVPGVVFASPELFAAIDDGALRQVANVATLPGIVEASYAMPDIHLGYGFPIGGVAATEIAAGGVVSPGGVRFDISCGVRLLTADLLLEELGGRLSELMDALDRSVPRGLGRGGAWQVGGEPGLSRVLREGARAPVAAGLGTDDDLARCEDGGVLPGADPLEVSGRALARGLGQLGSLGSGNHFLEIQVVDEIFDDRVATGFGLSEHQVCVMIHCGSRGLGHQVCADHVRRMLDAMGRYGIAVPDRQLACAPLASPEGGAYLAAMRAAANYAWANRATIAHRVREAISRTLGPEVAAGTRQVYDVAHNVAKIETHGGRELCVHRKGATRAFPAGHEDVPPAYASVGQPVFIPGSMGTSSFVLAGAPGAMERSFGTVCHGAGRQMSRTGARKRIAGAELRRQLEAKGIVVRCPSNRGLAEEAPFAYKDVERVVAIVEQAGLARRVAKLTPLGVVKG